ncbi:hypothetical protein Pcinc_012468 [Petrolisthes cinctipes]|uniref:Large ribosomal subunit protein P2 n=1 Tax=Petrolisthes cinctipes TaxID=88211 RepID=A0AAE1KSJ2_PETCI|nr:hypothetical protein Pcinc_012468 [Petrolisthes cinctipes]
MKKKMKLKERSNEEKDEIERKWAPLQRRNFSAASAINKLGNTVLFYQALSTRVHVPWGSTQFKMRHVAAFLLAAMGSSQPNAAIIKTILGSVGVEADDKQLDILIQKMAGKNVDQILAAGSELISAVPAGGGGAAAAGAAATADAKPAAEEKKEEKKEEPEEESDDDMGFGLFD